MHSIQRKFSAAKGCILSHNSTKSIVHNITRN